MNIRYNRAVVKVKTKKSMVQADYGQAIGKTINKVFSDNGKWTSFHKSRKRKGYTFSTLINDKTGYVTQHMETNAYGTFYLYAEDLLFLQRVEDCLFESDFFKVLEVGIDTLEWKGPVKQVKIKNPLLLKNSENEKRNVLLLRETSTQSEKEEYKAFLNKIIQEDFEYITKEKLPDAFEYVVDIFEPKVAHYNIGEYKLLGTKCNLAIDQTILGKTVTQHLIHYGIGNKSSYLGAGSLILKGESTC
ncbi:MAG: hypothetical protein ACK5NA_02575 [Enterococcus sp.]